MMWCSINNLKKNGKLHLTGYMWTLLIHYVPEWLVFGYIFVWCVKIRRLLRQRDTYSGMYQSQHDDRSSPVPSLMSQGTYESNVDMSNHYYPNDVRDPDIRYPRRMKLVPR